MAVIAWGKPLIEYAPYVDGELPSVPSWSEMPISKDGTSQLTTTRGDKQEAKGEGGELVDVRYQANTYQFETEVFVKTGDDKPIADADGIVIPYYAVRVTPEDETAEGFVINKAKVTVEETWSSAEGKLLKYIFDGLKPESGNILQAYTKPPAGGAG